jgi:hypothetical protein
MPLPTAETAQPPPPLAALPGTGGAAFFRMLNLTGWQATWTPEEASAALVAAKAALNPALVLDLPEETDSAAVEAAAKAFGQARGARRRMQRRGSPHSGARRATQRSARSTARRGGSAAARRRRHARAQRGCARIRARRLRF